MVTWLVARLAPASLDCLRDDCQCAWQVSQECWGLLLGMLAMEPALRPSLAQIAAHPWVCAGAPRELLRLNSELLSEARG